MKTVQCVLGLTLLMLMLSVRAATVEYKVLGVNDLGMHCVDDDFSTMTILPPFNVVQGQVIRITDGVPKLVTDGVEMTYSATPDLSGSINSSWIDKYGKPKTNFWDYASKPNSYGLVLPAGEGIFGLTMPADATSRAKRTFSMEGKVFKGAGIPILPIDDDGKKNPYPLLQLEARDATTHALLTGGKTAVVVPVSDETTCANCHLTGKAAADPGNAAYHGVAWSQDPNSSIQYRENVLKLHDFKTGTTLEAKKPVLCAGCHYSAALDLYGEGPQAAQIGHRTMSAAIHGFHADKMALNGKALPDRAVPVGGKVPDPKKQSCYQCHPGSDTRCLRGAMSQNVTCQNCHGNMAATGGGTLKDDGNGGVVAVDYQLRTGGSLDGNNDGGKRRPWTDLPRCQSCHTGDEVNHLTTTAKTSQDGLRQHFAFARADKAASPFLATNKRFAEEGDTLFRFSKGHGEILCENCHDSTHAIWPSDPSHPNDDVAAKNAQGHAGTLIECRACHTKELKPSLDGPHGLHNVDDKEWYGGSHGDFYEKHPSECKACHGTDFRGSVLGRVAVARTFKTDFGTKSYAQGDRVTCYDCHDGPNFKH